MFENFTILAPYVFLLLPLFVLLDYFSVSQQTSYYMPHLKYLHHTVHISKNTYKIFKWLMIFFTLFALSNPVLNRVQPTLKKNAIDIVLALDTSGSMSLYGFNPKTYSQTRLDVVKEVISSFIAQRKDDRIGVVVFGTYSAIVSPLSFERKAQQRIVQGLKIGALGKSTALLDAVVSSVRLLKVSHNKSKVIIVLSDGEDSSSQIPLSIVKKLLLKYHIKIYTIIIDKTHSNMMSHLAKTSNTKPYTAKNKNDLSKIYKQINALEKTPTHYHTLFIPTPLYAYFLALGLLCGFILLFLRREKGVI